MVVSRQRLSKDLLKSDPKKGFAAEKEAILKDESLRKMFREICKQKFSDCDAVVNTVYNISAKKIVHARYVIQCCRFKEKAVTMKNKIELRNHLKVAAALKVQYEPTKTYFLTNQRGYDKSETTDDKLSERRIQIY